MLSYLLASKTRTSTGLDFSPVPPHNPLSTFSFSSSPTHTRHPFVGERIKKAVVIRVHLPGRLPETTTESLRAPTELGALFLCLRPLLSKKNVRELLSELHSSVNYSSTSRFLRRGNTSLQRVTTREGKYLLPRREKREELIGPDLGRQRIARRAEISLLAE